MALLCAVLALAVAPAAAVASSTHSTGSASFYTLKNARKKCKAHYTKQTVTLRVRKHHHWVHVHQVRCVYTGSGSSLGAAPPSFPSNLPTAGVTVTVIPTANPDTYGTLADQTLDVASPGVLANDDGLALTAAVVSGPAHGTLTLKADGSFRYMPDTGYSGIDHFSYRDGGSDGEYSAPTTVTLDVTPVAAPAGPYGVGPGSTLQVGAPGVLAGDVGNELSASLVSSPGGGSLTLDADGSFTYTPYPSFAGADSFQFEAVDADGVVSNVVTVIIDVGAGPVSVVPETFNGAIGNTELQVGGSRAGGPVAYVAATSPLTAGDGAADGNALTTTPEVVTSTDGGTVTVNADGTFSYQPLTGFDGPSDSFSYQVDDAAEGTSATATATIDFTGARVWYVEAGAAAGGDGSSTAPFNSLASVSPALASGDTVFLYAGSYAGGVTLSPDDTLVGQSAGLWVGDQELVDPSGSNPVVGNSGGAGISLVAGDAVSGISVSGTSGAGISVSNADTFTIGANVTISGAGADGIDISGGSGDATVGATISGSAGHSVEVSGRQGGILTFSGPITDTGDGVALTSNNGATISFTGGLTSTTTNADPAFQATGGGTVTVTGSDNTLSTQDATALDVDSTTIGGAGLNFQTISAGVSATSGPAEGVVLSDTGNGQLTVTGTHNLLGSGGDIEGTTVAAVSASNAEAVSLRDMDMTLQGGDGVEATSLGALAVFSSQITGGASGIVATGTSNAQANGLLSFDIEFNVLSGQQDSALSLTYAGTSSGSVVQNLIGSESPLATGSLTGDGIDLWPVGGGTLEATVSDNTVDQIDAGVGIEAGAPDGGILDLTLVGNEVNMDSPSSQDGVQVGSAGTVCLVPTANDVTAAGESSSANDMELDLTSGSVFQIQDLGTADPVSYVEGVNTLNPPSGGGAPAAVTNPSDFIDAPADCPAPSGGSLD
jgi:Bacterial Ig domain